MLLFRDPGTAGLDYTNSRPARASGPGDATVLMDFPGIDDPNSFCDCEPPDPHVAVGPEHVVQVVNSAIAIYNKDGSVAVES